MAVISQSLVVRVFFFLSLVFNVVFISRSFTGRTAVQTHANQFQHRAVVVKEELNAGNNSTPESPTRPPKEQPPIHDASQEVAAESYSQHDAPLNSAATNADQARLVSPSAHIRTGKETQVVQIKHGDDSWTVIEDLSQRDGDIIFESTKTKKRIVFPKTGEAAFQEYDARYPEFAGLQLANIGLATQDLLANRML